MELWSWSYWNCGVGLSGVIGVGLCGVMELVVLELWSWSYCSYRVGRTEVRQFVSEELWSWSDRSYGVERSGVMELVSAELWSWSQRSYGFGLSGVIELVVLELWSWSQQSYGVGRSGVEDSFLDTCDWYIRYEGRAGGGGGAPLFLFRTSVVTFSYMFSIDHKAIFNISVQPPLALCGPFLLSTCNKREKICVVNIYIYIYTHTSVKLSGQIQPYSKLSNFSRRIA